MAVTWDYDGAGTLLVHLSTSVLGHTYEAFTGDFNGGDGTTVGTGGAITITVTGIGGNTAGDEFYATVRCDADLTYLGVNVFMYGTPSTTGVGWPATWTYDGGTEISVTFDTDVADHYAMRASWYDTGTEGGFAFATGPGSPLMMAISLSSTPAAGSILVAWIVDNDTPNTSTVASRVFVEGVADAGLAGDPGTGGTETGTPSAGPTGPTGPPATTGYAPTFTVTNLEHDGSEVSTFTPIAGTLRWTYRLCQSGGPGDGEWAVALSDPSIVTADQFAPFRTDWKITMHYPGEADEDLIAGILGPVNTGSEPSGVFGQVRCTGKDWLYWLEQPYPFGYAAVVADVVANQLEDPSNLFKQWIGATQETIVGDLITALDGNVGAVVFSASYEGTGWTLTLDKEVAFGDNTSVLDLILDIAKLATVGTDQYGFDMWCDPDKTVHLVAPRVTDPAAVVPLYTLDDANVVAPPLDWTNNGPLETDSVIFGQANNNTARIGFSDYAASQTVYRQWTQFQQVSLAEEDAIAAAAAGIGQQDRFPQKNLKITIRPDLLDPLDPRVGFRSQLGQGITVHYVIAPYHTIFADFYIVEQAYYSPDGCNWLCDLTLQQIYTANANPDTS